MFKKKLYKFLSIFATLALLFNSFAAPILTSAQEDGDGGGNPGAIWTTKNDCGDETQDENLFDQGEGVFINGSGFDPGDYSWDIKGKPGGASGDPDTVVASGVETVDDTGSFCIDDPDPAYTVASDDWGEYQVKFGNKGDNYHVDREILEGPGSVTVCKVILDPQSNVVDGSEVPGANFSVSWDGSDAPIGPSNFTTPLSLNTSLFGDNADGECITYGQLPIGNYYYGEEAYPAAGWETPLYNDFFDPQATGLGDFTPYFDREDPNRNMNSDGHIVLTEGRPNRTLAVLNQYQRIPDPTRIIVYKITNPEDDGQTPFGVTLFDATGDAIGTEETLTTSSRVVFEVEPGVYWVNETTVPGGWSETRNSCQELGIRRGQTVECRILNTKLGSIQGRKYYDVNGNGDFDQDEKDEPGDPNRLNGWLIELYDDQLNYLTKKETGHTGSKGQYRFENVYPGTYYVCEVLQNGWTQTEPAGQGCHEVQVGPGQAVAGIQFGNYELGSIFGYKYEDIDGSLGTDEYLQNPVQGWEIELWQDLVSLGSTTTALDGYYSFRDLLTGNYQVVEETRVGWTHMTPAFMSVELAPGENEGPVDFVNYENGSITIEKDVVPDDASSWNFRLTGPNFYSANFNVSDGGSQLLPNLVAGTYYIIETLQAGYHVSDLVCNASDWNVIEEGAASVELNPGEDLTCIFTNTRDRGDIYGRKWNDLDGDRFWDEGEMTLGGWTINLHENNNGVPGTIIASTQTELSGQSLGHYNFQNILTGTYFVCEELEPGWEQTYPYPESCHQITLEGNDSFIREVDFGNQFVELDISIDKSNDKPDSTFVGETVTYTLVVTNNGNRVLLDPQIIDVLPGGFEYVGGSTTVEGLPFADPTEVDGKLVWDLTLWGIKPQTSLTLVYQATIGDDVADGIHTNLATCKARYGEWILERINGDGEGLWIECNIDDSSVTIGSVLDISAGVEPQVLGIKTELPAAGSDTELMMGIMLAGALGFVFKLVSKKLYEEDN